MTPLEDMPIGHRIAITVAIVVAILLALALYGYLTGSWDLQAAPQEKLIQTSKWDDHIDALEKQAIDDAFKKHIGQLYNIWVTDSYQPRIPPKALAGARNARDAYIRSMEAIEQRQQAPR
jgi:hypothetical protein